MGKRKERRLAALSNAGRRVKLDLFAEPSGDLGGSSIQEEVEDDLDVKRRAGLPPNSPCSSGQAENPLLLLGQYSDDEVDVTLSDGFEANESFVASDNEVKESGADHCKMGEVDGGVEPAFEIAEHPDKKDSTSQVAFQNLNDTIAGDTGGTTVSKLCKEMDPIEENSVPGETDSQMSNDVHFGWKMVLHEGSNQYYYWNTETGETSWTVPEILSQATEMIDQQQTLPVFQQRETGLLGIYDSSPKSAEEHDMSAVHNNDGAGVSDVVSEAEKSYEVGRQDHKRNDGNEEESLEAKTYVCDSDRKSFEHEPGAGTEIDMGMHQQLDVKVDAYEAGKSCRLISHCECLLERLKMLKQSEGLTERYGWVSKCIVEVEVRLSDIRALMSYGASILPYWEYSEQMIKQLEGSINDEISRSFKKVSVAETTDASDNREEDKLIENLRHQNGTSEHLNGEVFSSEQPVPSVTATSRAPQTDTDTKAHKDMATPGHVSSSACLLACMSDAAGYSSGYLIGSAGAPAESSSKLAVHAVEDVDMDVDMEVEDVYPDNSGVQDTITQDYALSQDSVQPNTSLGSPWPVTEDELSFPPPPDEEWIPPPPPDGELVPPPPPPDDQPEPQCPPPPAYSEPMQPFSYQPYQLAYASSNFEFYGQTVAEVPSNLYGHAEGHQGVVPHQTVYYDVLPGSYADSAPAMVNHGESVAYYNIEDGSVPPDSVDANAESSGFHVESGLESYINVCTVQTGSVDANFIHGANKEAGYPAFGTAETIIRSLDVSTASTSNSRQAVEITSLKESAAGPAPNLVTSATPTDGTSTTVKSGSKVTRNKKRTVAVAPTLRSNKKVSKLVDKWKAAKEELHEDDEDEPDNAFDFLEKKKRREIENWHAQQIASGDAKENANFQPLGGDWRERVKRRRATREKAQSLSAEVADGNQPPDLVDISKDLPHGWQAFWDESSKQVYYGNTGTSETTWTRPTQ